jgi:aminopeptidase N
MKKKFITAIFLQLGIIALVAQEKQFSRADTLRGTLTELRSSYDVTAYDLDIAVDMEAKTISGSNAISFTAVRELRRLQIDLFNNMSISSVSMNGKELKYTREFNAVFVDFPEVIKKGAKAAILVRYSGMPQIAKRAPWDGGFSWTKDGNGDQWLGVSCQGTGASLWWPCKDHQSDEPERTSIQVTVPEKFMAVCNGRLTREESAGAGLKRFRWEVSYPINNYNVTLNVARYAHFSDHYFNAAYADTLQLDYYVLRESLNKAKEQFAQVKPMMDVYYKRFGEYPFVKDGFKLIETPYLGMEHQSAVAYGNGFRNGYRGMDLSGSGYGQKFDYIIIHESAHEWWGNNITTNDIADMWVHEGFTQYAEALYVEELFGYDAYLKYINGLRTNVANDIPVIGVYNVNSEGSGDMYPKGALLVHTLRGIIDDDKFFFKLLLELQTRYRHSTVNSGDIEAFFSQRTGVDLSHVFDVYLRDVTIPVLELRTSSEGSGTAVEYRWKPATAYLRAFDMPVAVTAGDGKKEIIFPTASWQTLHSSVPEKDFKAYTEKYYIDCQYFQRIKK